MKYNQLGRTGLFVSELCLGTMTLGGNANAGVWSSIGSVAQEEANQLIAQALAGGINFIDTADIYSFGHSERITGVALNTLSALSPHYPGWMIKHQDAERYPQPFPTKAHN